MTEQDENSQSISELDDQHSSVSSSSMEELQGTLRAKSDELQALQDKYLRQIAEFDNYKKLAQRDRLESSKFANENLLRDLLPIIDNLERAVKAAKDASTTDSLIRGVELTLKQFSEVLGKFGVQHVTSVGASFDPARHQAMTRIETRNEPENHVIEEFQKGYLLHDRILRPAMVSVAVAPADSYKRHTEKTDAD